MSSQTKFLDRAKNAIHELLDDWAESTEIEDFQHRNASLDDAEQQALAALNAAHIEAVLELEQILKEPLAQLIARYEDKDGREHYDHFIATIEVYLATERNKAVREELEMLRKWNGSIVHSCGKRIDGFVHHKVIETRLSELEAA